MFNKQIILFVLILMFVFPINISTSYAKLNNPFQKEVNTASTIKVIDPFTKKEIKTITPDEYQLVTNIALYKTELDTWVHEFAKGYKKPMILDKIDENGEVIKGKPLITVNENVLIEQMIQHSFTGGEIELPLSYTQSDYSVKDIPHLNEVVLASFTTYFRANKSGRSKNIELSALSINNVIVGNNDIFSFNSVVGPRDVSTGYQRAPEIIKGKLVMGIGGGICQVSSTLFNATDQLDLKVLERHHHSKDVGYVEKGRDATVSFGGLDFIFQNTTGIPLLIKTYYNMGSITVQIKTSREYEHILKNEF